MGPRSGSPAAEAIRENADFPPVSRLRKRAGKAAFFVGAVISLLCLCPAAQNARAETAQASVNLTIVVAPPELAFREEAGQRHSEGEGTLTTRYHIKNNDISGAPAGGILTTRLEESPQGVLLHAQAGAFDPEGVPAGGEVYAVSPEGQVVVSGVSSPLLGKTRSPDNGSHLLSGTVPVTWKVRPASGEESSSSESLRVTLTLKDS